MRLNSLIETSTGNFYDNICQYLFNRHKPMYAFLLCYRIVQVANEIHAREPRFLIVEPAQLIEEGENPTPD
jgi:hypothetical protein